MAQSITALQQKSVMVPFRRCEIKRRLLTGGYEADWYDVSDLVSEWPAKLTYEVDYLEPGQARIGTLDLQFRNDEGQFAIEDNKNSIFNSYLTRHRTKVRVQTGLKDTDGTEYPSDPTVFLGIFTDEIADSLEDVEVVANENIGIFQEVPVTRLFRFVNGDGGAGSTLTTSDVIFEYIRDMEDSSGNFYFQEYFSTTQWLLTNTGHEYEMPHWLSDRGRAYEGVTIFEYMQEISQGENYALYQDPSGNLVHREKDPTGSVAYEFAGPGANDINIVEVDRYNDGANAVYTDFRAIFFTSGTTARDQVATSAVYSANTNTDASKFGPRAFEFTNYAIRRSTTAGSICSLLLSYYGSARKELVLKSKYITQLGLLDKVCVTYPGNAGGDGSLWGSFTWGVNLWSGRTSGLRINSETYHIMRIEHNMDDFISTFYLREDL